MVQRTALIGFGLAGSVFHAPLIAATPGLELLDDRHGQPLEGRAGPERVPRRAHRGRRRGDLERAEDHELVVVAAPNEAHAELASHGIDAGLAVVVDKPLAPTSGAARRLIERAEREGVALTVFHNRRWDSDQLTLRRLIADGSLGDVHRYESRFERWRPERREDAWRETTPPEEGGGVLLDLGTHLVDQALALFGPVRAVHGEVAHGGAARPTMTPSSRSSTSPESAATCGLPRWQPPPGPASGSRKPGRLPGGRRRWAGGGAGLGVAAGGSAGWGAEPEEKWGRFVRRARPAARSRSENGAWPQFYEQLERALRGEGPLPVDPRDAVAVLDISSGHGGRLAPLERPY